MFIEDVSIETIRVGETLGPGAFSDADNSVLLWVKNSPLGKARYKVNGSNCYLKIIIFIIIIVSITKFSIEIGSSRAYLSRNRRVITWVSNYRCPIWTFCNRTPVIGYPRDNHVNYSRFLWFP